MRRCAIVAISQSLRLILPSSPITIFRHSLRNGIGASPAELLADQDLAADVEEQVNKVQEVEMLREEILNLKDQERLVLSLYYFEELKLHEIASILGVTESRVSQIRSKAITNLRARMGHLREELCA